MKADLLQQTQVSNRVLSELTSLSDEVFKLTIAKDLVDAKCFSLVSNNEFLQTENDIMKMDHDMKAKHALMKIQLMVSKEKREGTG